MPDDAELAMRADDGLIAYVHLLMRCDEPYHAM